MNRIAWLVVAPLLMVGCSVKGGETASNSESKDQVRSIGQNGEALESGNDSAILEGSVVEIPDRLMTDGLRALGAPFDKPIYYRVEGAEGGPHKGELHGEVTKREDGKYILEPKYTDQLANLFPEQEFEITEDGIFLVKLNGVEIEPPALFLPAEIEVGTTWERSITSTQIIFGVSVTSMEKVKVVRHESVTVPLGTFDAIVVEETGTMKGEGISVKSKGFIWYVKGMGAVKMTSSLNGVVVPGADPKQAEVEIVAIVPPRE